MSKGKLVTLCDCEEVNTSFSVPGIQTSELVAVYALIGANVETHPPLFKALKVLYNYTDLWLWKSGFEISSTLSDPLPEQRSFTVSYSHQTFDPVKCGNASISFSPTFLSKPEGLTEWHLYEKQFIKCETNPPVELSDYLDGYFYHIANFVSLGIGEPIVQNEVRGELSDGSFVEIYYRTDNLNTKASRHPSEMLFSYKDIQSEFPELLGKWFEKRELLKPVYDLYFATVFSLRIPIENRFLNLVHALESYHRRTEGGTYLDPEVFASIQEKLTQVIDGDVLDSSAREALRQKLKFMNEYGLRRRIRDIVRGPGQAINEGIGDEGTFLHNVVETRNYLTHYDSGRKEKALTGEALWLVTEKVKSLVEVCLLYEMGLSDETVKKLCSKYPRYGGLRSRSQS